MVSSTKVGSDDFDPHDWPFFWMTQTVGRYLQRLERGLKKAGLDVPRWRVLMCVNNRKTSVGEIAELAIVKLPTMMKIIQRMEAEGLVLCETRPSDGRFTDVSLTPQGREARKTAWEIANHIYTTSFKGVSAKQEAVLNQTLKDIFERLDG